MSDGGRLSRFLRRRAHMAGRRYEEARRAYWDAHNGVLTGEVPTDEAGRARIVCRRYAERRAVRIENGSRPTCFEPDHPDCEGCRDDIILDRVETW